MVYVCIALYNTSIHLPTTHIIHSIDGDSPDSSLDRRSPVDFVFKDAGEGPSIVDRTLGMNPAARFAPEATHPSKTTNLACQVRGNPKQG
jgi:hypothetical protein